MSRHEELIGEKINGLEILKVFKEGRRYHATFKCHCGREHTSQLQNIKGGQTRSCGCRRGDPKEINKVSVRPKSQSKLINDGSLEVFETGEIIRFNKYGEFFCPQYRTSRNNDYLTIRPTIYGKQETFYVHRLIAEAFVPNPNNYTVVSHKDGNKVNNHPSNLMWTTYSGAKYHAFEKGFTDPYINGHDCITCKSRTNAKDKVCPSCKVTFRTMLSEAHGINERMKEFSGIDMSLLTKKQKVYASLRNEGLTMDGIAERLGVTTQAVQQTLSRILRRVSND